MSSIRIPNPSRPFEVGDKILIPFAPLIKKAKRKIRESDEIPWLSLKPFNYVNLLVDELPAGASGDKKGVTMTKIGTPNNIDVLLHYYRYQGGDSDPHPHIDYPAVQDTIKEFVALEVLKVVKSEKHLWGHQMPHKGNAWVKVLCNVSCPRVLYVDENGKIVDEEKR